ncbi:arginase [Paenibacillus sp. GCM10023252]|uniref:arginase n=1 Tax=Paenibacillus sp. GCM10023252 TaxID=3252649 RepID=UPI003616794E
MRVVESVSIVTVPFDGGGSRRGASQGPEAIIQAGLERKLMNLGLAATVEEPVGPLELKDMGNIPELKYLNEVAGINEMLAGRVASIAGGSSFPLVLGGDHSIAIGTLAGLAQHYNQLGVIWIDAHSDMNTPETTPSGNIHGMSLAVSLGQGVEKLTSIGGSAAKIRPRNVVIIGARQLDPGEREYIRKEGITCFTMTDIDKLGMPRVMEEAIRVASEGTDGVHVSFDIDSVDPNIAPGTGTPVQGGLSYREAHLAMEMLYESGIVTSAEFVEVSPTLDQGHRTSRLVVELIGSLLGERIL